MSQESRSTMRNRWFRNTNKEDKKYIF